MHEDYEYVKSLEKEVDELESEKADFSNIYDLLLEECVSKDVICSYLHSLSDLNAYAELQCLYLHKVKEFKRKLIEKCKGKSVETQFDKPSVVRQPNAQRIPKPSFLGKPTPFSNSPEMRKFAQIRKQAVRNTNVVAPGPSRNNPKHVSFLSPKEFVGSNDMVHNYYLEKAKKSAQLQKDKDVNGKPSND
ncbi:hypothetical protein Tco_0276201 [Tanacetum coccineum]